MGDINLGITFSSIYNVSQGNKKKFLEGNSNFFDKKLRILWEIILPYVLAITMIFYRSSIWENIYIKDIIIWFLFSGLIYCMNAVSR